MCYTRPRMEINWPHVRQVILNDRVNGYKPDKAAFKKLSAYLPDMRVLGFGKYYEYHWYVIVESVLYLPYTETPMGLRGAVPLSSIINNLARIL